MKSNPTIERQITLKNNNDTISPSSDRMTLLPGIIVITIFEGKLGVELLSVDMFPQLHYLKKMVKKKYLIYP